MRTTLVIGDLHLPWGCTRTVSAIYSAIEKHQPKIVVQVGDLYDMFSMTRFARSLNVITPAREIEEGRRWAEAFWKNVYKRAPRAKRFQLLGNHDVRPLIRVQERAPELESLVQRGWEDLFKFVGVETLWGTRDDLEIDGVVFEHGYLTRPGQHMRENMKPTVLGHTHRGWVHFEKIRRQMLWELNVGYAADPSQEPLSYPKKKWVKWTPGYGLIDGDGPRFVPLLG